MGFVYDRQTFKRQRTFQYTGEGWGLTHDGTRLIMSDGSSTGTLKFFDPETLRQTGTITVRDGGRPVAVSTRLEFVKGQIYANVWQTDRIAIIARRQGASAGGSISMGCSILVRLAGWTSSTALPTTPPEAACS